jgi:hypothetical protein
MVYALFCTVLGKVIIWRKMDVEYFALDSAAEKLCDTCSTKTAQQQQ